MSSYPLSVKDSDSHNFP